MSQFQQPPSENTRTLHKDSHATRAGDWICVQCNNLNFSFRKRCNRCKTQTKHDNFQQIQQAYSYYQQYYKQFTLQQSSSPVKQNTQQNSSIKQNSHFFPTQCELGGNYEQQCWELDLPSVSPIIRRYKKEKTTPKTQISQGWSSDEQAMEDSEYLKKYCWQNIMIEDDIQNQYSDCDPWDKEIEQIVLRIVL